MEPYHRLSQFLGLFMPLAEEEFAILKRQTRLVHFNKKELLTTAGESELYLYFIVSGLIREFFYKGSEQITSDLIAEGTITGSVTSFFTGVPSHYCLEAMEPVTAIAIHKGQLEELYRSNRKWEKFGRILTTHFLLQQERQILDSSRFNTKERFLHFMKQYPELLSRVPQKYLASFLQIKPETFSRMKHLLVAKNKKTNVG